MFLDDQLYICPKSHDNLLTCQFWGYNCFVAVSRIPNAMPLCESYVTLVLILCLPLSALVDVLTLSILPTSIAVISCSPRR